MAKLYFRHGTVSSAKTLNLLAVAHNYRSQGKRVVLIKPAIDDRFGSTMIRSRAGIEQVADVNVGVDQVLDIQSFEGASCILVDEAQFLAPAIIEQLRDVAVDMNIPVICYGLRADFRTRLFEGAARLFELADSIEEIKTTCAFCNRKAITNLKHVGGVATLAGPAVDLGAEEKYFPACYACYKDQLSRVFQHCHGEANSISAEQDRGRIESMADQDRGCVSPLMNNPEGVVSESGHR